MQLHVAQRALRPLLVVLLVACLPGCFARQRINTNCEWTHDVVVPLNLQNTAAQRHLDNDAQLAEELALRHADVTLGRKSGLRHGGPMSYSQLLTACRTRLEAVIQQHHSVTFEQVEAARLHRNAAFDAAIIVSFGLVYGLACLVLCRLIATRFTTSERRFAWVVTAIAAFAASALGVQLAAMWSDTAEMIRVGNDHIGGYRAAPPPWHQHVGLLYICGLGLFWLAALIGSRRSAPDGPPLSDLAPPGLRLR
jgi:hypothetical protein